MSCSGVGLGFDGLSARLCRRALRLETVDVVLVESTEAESDFMDGFSEYMVEGRGIILNDGYFVVFVFSSRCLDCACNRRCLFDVLTNGTEDVEF